MGGSVRRTVLVAEPHSCLAQDTHHTIYNEQVKMRMSTYIVTEQTQYLDYIYLTSDFHV
jgi:hypothetical protein